MLALSDSTSVAVRTASEQGPNCGVRVVHVRGNAFLSKKLLDPLAVGHPDHEQVVHVRDIACLRGQYNAGVG